MLYLALIFSSPGLLAVGLCWCYACAALYAATTCDPNDPSDDDSPGPNMFGHI